MTYTLAKKKRKKFRKKQKKTKCFERLQCLILAIGMLSYINHKMYFRAFYVIKNSLIFVISININIRKTFI